jgi:hypothetical protein
MVLTVLLFLVAVGGVTIAGCIRRYPAPTEPLPAPHPYSAIVTYRRILLPPLPEDAAPLPDSALRLAIGPSTRSVFADTALVDGRDQGRTADGWEAALELLSARTEPIVLLGDSAALTPATCETLAPLRDRLLPAGGRSFYADDGPEPRTAGEGSQDPLGRIALTLLCPAGP